MDNKLTKKRLSDYLSYEWILMIIVVAALIVVWELVYTVSAVRLTSGQQFRYYYDENIYSGNDANFYDLLEGENGEKTFSYDVLSAGYEALNSQYNVLSVRLSVYEGDAIFTDSTEDENGSSRMKNTVDGYSMYTFTHLEEDGINYLSSFLKDEYAGLSFAEKKVKVYDYNNLDESKIDAQWKSSGIFCRSATKRACLCAIPGSNLLTPTRTTKTSPNSKKHSRGKRNRAGRTRYTGSDSINSRGAGRCPNISALRKRTPRTE